MSGSSLSRRPWWLGLAPMAIGALWLHGAGSIASSTNFVGLGPAAAIYAVGAGLVLLGSLLLAQHLRSPAAARDEGDDAGPFSWRDFLLALAGVALPLLTMKPLGFPLTALCAFVLVTHAFGSRRTLLDIGIGGVLAVLVWWAFSRLGIALGPFFPLLH